MNQQFFYVGVFIVLIAMLPILIRWLVRQNFLGKNADSTASKIVSVVAVGPSQRIVSLEAVPEGDRRFFVLGVTGQSVTCLHNSPVPARTLVSADQIQSRAEHVTPT